jgi:hypothetical protein
MTWAPTTFMPATGKARAQDSIAEIAQKRVVGRE